MPDRKAIGLGCRSDTCDIGHHCFSFVNEGIESARERAVAAATGKHVRIGRGASTVCQYLTAGLVGELQRVLVTKLPGSSRRVLDGVDGLSDSYEVAE